MSACQQCGTPYAAGRHFCGQCRHVLGVRCGCGFSNTHEDQYCGNCGIALQGVTQDDGTGQRDASEAGHRMGTAKPIAYDIVSEVKSEMAHFNRLARRMHRDDIKTLFRSRKAKK